MATPWGRRMHQKELAAFCRAQTLHGTIIDLTEDSVAQNRERSRSPVKTMAITENKVEAVFQEMAHENMGIQFMMEQEAWDTFKPQLLLWITRGIRMMEDNLVIRPTWLVDDAITWVAGMDRMLEKLWISHTPDYQFRSDFRNKQKYCLFPRYFI